MTRIAVIEDDERLAAAIEDALRRSGHEVLAASGASQVGALLQDPAPDLAVLDINLDGAQERGLELIRPIRSARNIPIIAISAHSAPWERLRALELGIDEFVAKPFLMGELLIRIARVLGNYAPTKPRQAPDAGQRYAFLGYELDMARRSLARDGTPVELTETELRLLGLFAAAPARILTRDELWKELRGLEWSPLDRAIDGHVARLRRKLEPGADRPEAIKSVRGIGYVFTATVHRLPQ